MLVGCGESASRTNWEIPNSKHQIPNENENRNSKARNEDIPFRAFGHWYFVLVSDFVLRDSDFLGSWNLDLGTYFFWHFGQKNVERCACTIRRIGVAHVVHGRPSRP